MAIAIIRLAAALAIYVAFCVAFMAAAHEAPSGMRYDPECCSNMDCAPVVSITMNPDGSRTVTNGNGHTATFTGWVPIRPSTDGRAHACINPRSGRPICYYATPEF